MSITSITFNPSPPGTEVTFFEYYVDLGYCSSNELGAIYESNYVSGSKTRVFEKTSNVTFFAADPTIYFDTPFVFDPANGNLIIEIAWPDGEDEIYTYSSGTSGITCINGDYNSPIGDEFSDMSHMFINGDLALEQMTFAGIKASF
ncbi:MAG: hypothetical protein KAH54_07190 [Candidatus Sabulitectum sp.]|nr:hypothetical protein [Candidatus Sabulitectum sp.]